MLGIVKSLRYEKFTATRQEVYMEAVRKQETTLIISQESTA